MVKKKKEMIFAVIAIIALALVTSTPFASSGGRRPPAGPARSGPTARSTYLGNWRGIREPLMACQEVQRSRFDRRTLQFREELSAEKNSTREARLVLTCYV